MCANVLEWRKIEALFIALDCEIIEGNGSRVTFEWRTRRFPPSTSEQGSTAVSGT